MKGRPRNVVRAKDPLVRHLLDAVAASPLSDSAILAKAGCDGAALHRLRSGQRTGSVSTLASIAGAIDLELQLVRRR